MTENEILESTLREARNTNYRAQAQLIEVLSGKPLKINLPDDSNPTLLDLDVKEDEVSTLVQ